jgi:23S rRNA (uridine2552-2'-O)-methyltransferase
MTDHRGAVAVRPNRLLSSTVPAYVRKDAAYRRAKSEGFRSRAAYKLLELDAHFQLFRPGQRIVDLGCWPGAWTQVASRRVGPTGLVVGVDLLRMDDLGLANATGLVGDVADRAVRARVSAALGGPADVVLADLAPKLSGIAASDSARQAALVEAASAAALDWLRPGGIFLVKLFMDAEYSSLIGGLRASFATVKTRRPETTRRGSAEIYAFCRLA